MATMIPTGKKPTAPAVAVEEKTVKTPEAPKAVEAAPAAAEVKTAAAEKKATKTAAKTTAKATKAATKTTAKTTKAAAKAVSEEVYVQYSVMEWKTSDLVERAKALFVEQGNRASAAKSVKVYIKPEEQKAYFVINQGEGEFTGVINL